MINLNILFILPEYYPHSGGGISTYYIQYIETIKKHASRIKVIVGSGYLQSPQYYNIEGIEVEYLKPDLFQKYLGQFKNFNAFPEYQKNIAASWAMYEQSDMGKGYDIIECIDFGHGYIPWIINHKKPVVTRLHGSAGQIDIHEPSLNNHLAGDINRFTELSLLPHIDKLVTHSSNNQKFWQKIFPTKDITLIHPVYNAHLKEIVPNHEKNSFAMVCGRVQQWKGPDILCEAISNSKANIEPIHWFGKDTTYNKKQSKSQQLTDIYPQIWNKKILPSPPIDNKELMEIQRKTKFGIIPSTWDMFNFTCVEFLSNGTPVICSEYAGASDLIIDGVNGFKYKNNNPVELSKCLEKAANLDESAYTEMSKQALQTVQQKLSPDIILPLSIAVYEDLMNKELPTVMNVYLETIFKPSNNSDSITTVLDQQPLKSLINYIFKRIKSKIRP